MFYVVEIDGIAAGLGQVPITFTQPDSGAPVPVQRRKIADADTPTARSALALPVRNKDFADLVPTLFSFVEQRLADIRVCKLRDSWVLVYITRVPDRMWVGRDEASFGEALPRFRDKFPTPLRALLADVHAYFVEQKFESFDPLSPEGMLTYAEWEGQEGPILDLSPKKLLPHLFEPQVG